MEVPPLVTRPKAATVGVGRQVILRPAVQKRYVETGEPTLADQRPTSSGCSARSTTSNSGPTCTRCGGCGRVLRAADFKVTAVIVDEVLIDVEPGDTRAASTASRSTSAPPRSSPRCST